MLGLELQESGHLVSASVEAHLGGGGCGRLIFTGFPICLMRKFDSSKF